MDRTENKPTTGSKGFNLTRHLFAWEPSCELADYYELALINSILATQDPDTGMMMYFVTLAPGRWKYFNVPRDAFWCCTGTGMENHAKYGEAIYSHDADTLWVNQFIASQVHWKAKGVRIRQETKFPEQGRTRLTVRTQRPCAFEMRIRIPSWATGGATVFVNDKGFKAKPGTYARAKKTWRDGERITVSLTMSLHAKPMPDDPTLVALMVGPLVLTGRLGDEGLTNKDVHTTRNWFRFPREKVAPAPCFVADANDLGAWVKPVEGKPLTFRTVGAGRPNDVTLVPYHKLFGEKYAVYWRIWTDKQFRAAEAKRKAREAADAARRKALGERLVDQVHVGRRDSETAARTAAGGGATPAAAGGSPTSWASRPIGRSCCSVRTGAPTPAGASSTCSSTARRSPRRRSTATGRRSSSTSSTPCRQSSREAGRRSS